VKRNPKAKAELTLSQLDEHFRAFIDRYHHEVHSETGQTPLEFWEQHATPLPMDEPLLRLLDVLLKEPATRRVHKEGIKYAAELYWHPELAVLVGEYVLVRAAPHYTAPEEIEVFFEGNWRCTAFALTSPQGQTLERKVIVDAQRQQRAHARSRIKAAHHVYETLQSTHPSLDSAAKQQSTGRQNKGEDRGRQQPANLLPNLPTPSALPASLTTHQPDLFDFLVAQQADENNQSNSKGELP
jgi:hypothetical protein